MSKYNKIIKALEDIEETIELTIKEDDNWDNFELVAALECVNEAKESMLCVRRKRG